VWLWSRLWVDAHDCSATLTLVGAVVKLDTSGGECLAHGCSISGIPAQPHDHKKMRRAADRALALRCLDTLGLSQLLDVIASVHLALVWLVLAPFLEVFDAPTILLVDLSLAAMTLWWLCVRVELWDVQACEWPWLDDVYINRVTACCT
jgi:hypothetical protein